MTGEESGAGRLAAAVPSPSGERVPARRNLGLIAAAAVVMLVADYAMSSLVMLGLYALPIMLIGVPVTAVLLAAALVALSAAMTGRRNVLGSVAVTLLLAGVGAYGIVSGALTPLTWLPGLPPHLLVCALCALALGVFTGPWPLRAVGAAAVLSVLAVISLAPTSAEVAEAQRAEMEAQHRQEDIDSFLEDGAHPVVTDHEGWSNPRIHPTGASAMTWVRSDAGAVATILVQASVDEPTNDDWCYAIMRPGESDGTTTDALPPWCVETDAGWARADGTGTVSYDDGRLIAVNAASQLDAEQAGGTWPATAEDIATLAGSLRPMTDGELEQHVLPVYDSGDTPVIDAPGL